MKELQNSIAHEARLFTDEMNYVIDRGGFFQGTSQPGNLWRVVQARDRLRVAITEYWREVNKKPGAAGSD